MSVEEVVLGIRRSLLLQTGEAESGSGLPDWLIVAIVVVAIGLAVLSMLLMFARTRPSPDDTEQGRYPQLTREPVLIISAFIIIIIALAIFVLTANG